jgi:hypothetical protein
MDRLVVDSSRLLYKLLFADFESLQGAEKGGMEWT